MWAANHAVHARGADAAVLLGLRQGFAVQALQAIHAQRLAHAAPHARFVVRQGRLQQGLCICLAPPGQGEWLAARGALGRLARALHAPMALRAEDPVAGVRAAVHKAGQWGLDATDHAHTTKPAGKVAPHVLPRLRLPLKLAHAHAQPLLHLHARMDLAL